MGRFNILPRDIMTEILTRLPTESVLDCKLVCKTWRNVVCHPSFSQLHLTHLNSSDDDSCKFNFNIVSNVKWPKDYYYIEYDENYQETPFSRKTRMDLDLSVQNSFIASSNGLICLGAWRKEEDSQYHYGPCILCNPITREYFFLPKPKRHYQLTGFGYILSTNEYKVVRICGDSGIVQVYTLGSGAGWRDAGTMDINIKYVEGSAGKFVNGALHWVNRKGIIIHAFNLADEKFSKFPPQPSVPDFDMKLGVLGDFLSATLSYSGDAYCEIWLLKKNKDNYNDLSWSKEFSFNHCISWPFGYTKSGRLLWYNHNIVYSYDLKASSPYMDVGFHNFISQAIPHKNTLVSLKVLGEKDTKTMRPRERASSNE